MPAGFCTKYFDIFRQCQELVHRFVVASSRISTYVQYMSGVLKPMISLSQVCGGFALLFYLVHFSQNTFRWLCEIIRIGLCMLLQRSAHQTLEFELSWCPWLVPVQHQPSGNRPLVEGVPKRPSNLKTWRFQCKRCLQGKCSCLISGCF
jgi:hypothetical protein